ncbi:MAG: hypothetical protein RIS10_513, partial [Pseudomonadota bacterium]
MKPIIFTSALLLGSVIAGEALAADCPTIGQVMDISAQAEVTGVTGVTGVPEVLAKTESYTFTFPDVAEECFIKVGNKTFEADDDSSSDDVVKYFSKNAPSGWTVSNGVFTSKTAGADVADLTYSSSNSKKGKGNCATKPIISVTPTQGAAAVAAVAEVKEVIAAAEVVADPQLTTLLTGKTVCDANATYNNCVKHPGPNCIVTMGIQEQHLSGGALWDYKMGPSDAKDPTVRVGDWSITGNDADTVVK